METAREYAVEVMDALEDILESEDVTVPCDEADEADREDNEDAARLYGEVYYDLEDAVTDALESIENGDSPDAAAKDIFLEIASRLEASGVDILSSEGPAESLKASIADTVKKYLTDEDR